jgi:hypothetical protein
MPRSHICRRHEASVSSYWKQRCSFVSPHDSQEDLDKEGETEQSLYSL